MPKSRTLVDFSAIAHAKRQEAFEKGRNRVPFPYRASETNKQRFKRNARSRTNNAIKSGRIKKLPCEVCGSVEAEAHHDDYSDHLSIRWLCKRHHVAEHYTGNGKKSAE